jgi:hypothetical protein
MPDGGNLGIFYFEGGEIRAMKKKKSLPSRYKPPIDLADQEGGRPYGDDELSLSHLGFNALSSFNYKFKIQLSYPGTPLHSGIFLLQIFNVVRGDLDRSEK